MNEWLPCKQISVHGNQVFDPDLSSLSLSSKVTFVKSLINISNNGRDWISLAPLSINTERPSGTQWGLMHLPTALPELWVTTSPLGEPEQLLILKKHTRVPRQALPGPRRERGKAKKPFPLPPVMQEVPGQPSCKCGPVPLSSPFHFISGHRMGWLQQAASVLQILCETDPHRYPPCVCALCHGNTLAGCCRREPGGSCHTHTRWARLLCWSLVDTGGWTPEGCPPGPARVRRCTACPS